jgi:hypothetical protein
MEISSIGGRTESWAEFVKLVSEARARSQGIGGAMIKNKGVQKAAQFSAVGRTQQAYGIMKNEPATASPAANSLRTKISGSFFDAYA